tara:strand:- start:1181 stop:1540 length:360 start_codon:yes stop_codon:yes gene_type:complete
MLLRKAVSPMHLMSVDVVMKELEEVQKCVIPDRDLIPLIHHLGKNKELFGLRAKDDFLKFSSFRDHFSQISHFTTAMAEDGSDFLKMVELDYDLFVIKEYENVHAQEHNQTNPNEAVST